MKTTSFYSVVIFEEENVHQITVFDKKVLFNVIRDSLSIRHRYNENIIKMIFHECNNPYEIKDFYTFNEFCKAKEIKIKLQVDYMLYTESFGSVGNLYNYPYWKNEEQTNASSTNATSTSN